MDSQNNLNGMYAYLVGAMDRVKDGGTGWRQKISGALHDMNVKILDPCKSPIAGIVENDRTRDTIHYYKQTNQYDRINKEFGQIRRADLRCVDKADFIIAYIDINVHACGSYEEIFTANKQKKPVLVWCEQGKSMAPNWLFFTLPHEYIFSSMKDLLSYLELVNKISIISDLKRWFFFKQMED